MPLCKMGTSLGVRGLAEVPLCVSSEDSIFYLDVVCGYEVSLCIPCMYEHRSNTYIHTYISFIQPHISLF